MSQLDLEVINGSPVFLSPNDHPIFARVYGGTLVPERRRWLFPAYPPFGLIVAADLKHVVPHLVYSPQAQEHLRYLESIPQRIEKRILPEGFTFVTKPFDHQIEGLSWLYHYPRLGLFWEMGTAKTKVVIDLKRALPKTRMLVFGPPVTVRNWLGEMQVHGPELRAVALDGDPKRKRKIMREYAKYDVLVASYGTARNMALPRLHRASLNLIQAAQKAGKTISESGLKALVRSLRRVSDPDRQAFYVEAWKNGATFAEIDRQTAAEAAASPQWLIDLPYDIIVADESHGIKDISSQQTKAMLALSTKAPRRYLLTGTPSLGNPQDMFPQMKFLSPAIFPEDWFKFSDLFLVRSPYNKRIVTGYKNLNILNERIQRVAIRKTKDECLDLPERQIIDQHFDLSKEQARLYNTLVSAMGADLSTWFQTPDSFVEVQNAAVLLNKLCQVVSGFVLETGNTKLCDGCPHLARCVTEDVKPYTSRCVVAPKPPDTQAHTLKENPKLDALEELLDGILVDPKHKVIIWAVYKAEMDMIAERLKARNVGFVRVDGSNSGNVQTRIKSFNENADCRVYLGQIATGIGITLNAATYTIYYTLDWSLGTYLQSLDRNYRAGQTNKVTVYRLLGRGTIDTYKVAALEQKRDISSILTNKLACIHCEKRFECLRNKVELFDPGCIYQRSARRTIAKAEMLK
jgi:SNF2 family DNA or RNA helicase